MLVLASITRFKRSRSAPAVVYAEAGETKASCVVSSKPTRPIKTLRTLFMSLSLWLKLKTPSAAGTLGVKVGMDAAGIAS